MTIRYRTQTCYPCATQDGCEPFVLAVGDTLPVYRVKVFEDGSRPYDLSDFTAEATIFYNTYLYRTIEADAVQLRVEQTPDGETWPVRNDILFVGDSSTEMLVVEGVVDGVGTLNVLRDDIPRKHLETTSIKVVRAVLPATTVAVTDNDEYDGSAYLFESLLEVPWDNVAVQAPGWYYMRIRLTETETQKTVSLPRSGLGYRIHILG